MRSRRARSRVRAWTVLTTILVFAMGTSCTRAVRLSDDDLRTLTQEDGIGYKVVTVDGTVYRASRFELTSDHLIIRQLVPHPVFEPPRAEPPIPIPLDQIAYVERLEDRAHLGRVAGVTLIVVASAFILLAVLLINHGSWETLGGR